MQKRSAFAVITVFILAIVTKRNVNPSAADVQNKTVRGLLKKIKKKQMTPFEREFALLRLICMYLFAFFTLTKLEGSTVIEL